MSTVASVINFLVRRRPSPVHHTERPSFYTTTLLVRLVSLRLSVNNLRQLRFASSTTWRVSIQGAIEFPGDAVSAALAPAAKLISGLTADGVIAGGHDSAAAV